MPFGVPKTEEERKRTHKFRHGTSSLPPRGTGTNMPYGTKNEKLGKNIKACVSKLMADPKFKPKKGDDKKTAAIKICKSAIVKSEEMKTQLEE